jgi:hypothetical protein
VVHLNIDDLLADFKENAGDPNNPGPAIGGGVIVAQLIKAVGDIVGKIIEGGFRLGEGIASGNVDVVATAAVVAAALGLYVFFVNTEPYKTILHKLKLDLLYDILVTALGTIGQGPPGALGAVTRSIAAHAQTCIDKFVNAGFIPPAYWYQLRDTANASTTIQKFDNSLIGQLITFGVPTLSITQGLQNLILGSVDLSALTNQTVQALDDKCAKDFAAAKASSGPPPPPPGAPAGTTCVLYWRYKYLAGLFFSQGWQTRTFDNVNAAIDNWNLNYVVNGGALQGNLVEVTKCTAPDGTITETIRVIKTSPIHSDIN